MLMWLLFTVSLLQFSNSTQLKRCSSIAWAEASRWCILYLFFTTRQTTVACFVGQYIKIKVLLWYITDFMWSRRRIKLTTVNRAQVCCCILTSVIEVLFGRTLVLHIQLTNSCIFMMCIRELCCSIISSLPLTLTQTDTHHLEPLAAEGHAESHLPLILMILYSASIVVGVSEELTNSH